MKRAAISAVREETKGKVAPRTFEYRAAASAPWRSERTEAWASSRCPSAVYCALNSADRRLVRGLEKEECIVLVIGVKVSFVFIIDFRS